MEREITLEYPSPQHALNALNARVASRYDWTIMTGGGEDSPRFVVQRRVRTFVMRGLNTYTQFTLKGRFLKAKSGDVALRYSVMGEPVTTALYASVWLPVLLLPLIFIASPQRAPGTGWVAVVLVTVIGLGVAGYLWLVWRRYQGHIREMHALVDELRR